MSNLVDDLSMNGHLEIYQVFKDGSSVCLLDENNIIVSGMGRGLAHLFAASGIGTLQGSQSILNYQIDRFQIGVSGPPAGGVVSSINQLSGALTFSQYGAGSNLFVAVGNQALANTTALTGVATALIPASKITRVGESSVRYTITIDEEACNNLQGAGSEDLFLSEIGLLMRNPLGYTTPRSLLVAYKTFSRIRKTNDFSLIFRWTLNF